MLSSDPISSLGHLEKGHNNDDGDDHDHDHDHDDDHDYQLYRSQTKEEDLDLMIMHAHFSHGWVYHLRNIISVSLFVIQIITDILVAIQFYQDQHTNFSMSVVMIEVSMQLFTWRCTIRPIVSFYQAKDRFKEFVFHSRDLKGNKLLDAEKDDKIWYCTTSRDIRLKLRMDTTLQHIQGFIFAGRTGALLVALLIVLYCHNYGNNLQSLHSYTDIYYVSLVVSMCNFLYHLYLSVDLQYFIEMGGIYHFLWSDFFKYLMILGAFIVSDNTHITGTDAFLMALYFILMAISEWCVYQMMGRFGTSQNISKLSMFLTLWSVCILILIIQWGLAKDFHDASLVLYALCGLPCLSLWSKLSASITKPALERLKAGGSEKEWFFYGWILSSETGKSDPKGYQTYQDFRHKILAINTMIIDQSPDETELMNHLHTRAYDKVYHLTMLQEFTRAQSFWKYRPLYWRAINAWWYKKPIPEGSQKETLFFIVMFFACAILRFVALITPLTTYWFVQEWHPFLNACSICYVISICVAMLLYVRYLYFAIVIWHIMDHPNITLRLGSVCQILATIKEQESMDSSNPIEEDGLYKTAKWPAPKKKNSIADAMYGDNDDENENMEKQNNHKNLSEEENEEVEEKEDDDDHGENLDLQLTDDVTGNTQKSSQAQRKSSKQKTSDEKTSNQKTPEDYNQLATQIALKAHVEMATRVP